MIRLHILDSRCGGYFRHAPPYMHEKILSLSSQITGDSFHWYPIFLNRYYLSELGMRFDFYSEISDELFDCDILLLSSHHFDIERKDHQERLRILAQLKEMRSRGCKIAWFDMRDSTGNTQFEVLPYVDKYLKKQYLKDKNLYRQRLYANRIFSDYFHQRFGVSDSYHEENIPLPVGAESKLELSWNLGLSDRRTGGYLERVGYLLTDLLERVRNVDHRVRWTNPIINRDVNLVALFHTNYRRKTVAFQRIRALDILATMHLESSVIGGKNFSRRNYLKLLERSKIVLSLFGWGELCFREFEAFMAGACVMMPDVSHLSTWPDIYIPKQTYWPLRWDLEDLEESIDVLLSNEHDRLELAQFGQEIYRQQFSRNGREIFSQRLKNIINDILGN
ncbi:glycosyltransferase [Geomobilimonas luticola]|uniref:Spore protein YkvP/CgeB glycosyl transferase-like domain-containing protein n=1 Tax=Geomobilimonas luticola TaxID=1114878 RepID=A0ABS5SE64_9BACT|nr:glycosyltransferase [Geomobilimonas luticola]MBT0652937.1 hypothetical protein [Geomobilimonas luticola]